MTGNPEMLTDSRVAVIKEEASYASRPPFHPSEDMPEWNGMPSGEEGNAAYRGVRKLLHTLRLDIDNYGTPAWNPLGGFAKPGFTVVVKPNLVFHENDYTGVDSSAGFECLVTHGSVIRAVCDYLGKAMCGTGRILICDCPIQGAKWDSIVRQNGLADIVAHLRERWPGMEISLHDLRLVNAVMKNKRVVSTHGTKAIEKDYSELDLGRDSLLLPLMEQKEFSFGVADYPRHRMKKAHSPGRNLYLFPKLVLEADLLVNLPKLKTHMKAGFTCALKNLVGIIGHKDYLPHFRRGSPKNGGDEYPDGNTLYDLMWFAAHASSDVRSPLARRTYQNVARFFSLLQKLSRSSPMPPWVFGGGGWHGNDTIWRMIIDINRALFYYDRSTQQVSADPINPIRNLVIVDGLISGQGDGPLSPKPFDAGIMLAGTNPLAVDAVAASIMGFDIRKAKVVSKAFETKKLPLASFDVEDVTILGDLKSRTIAEMLKNHEWKPFEPACGYKGHIEYVDETSAA
jgi:uncharacterized protein (DUF362 family)